MGQVQVVIDDKGDVTIEVNGVPGPSCLESTKALEELLGTVTERTKTKEFESRERLNIDRSVRQQRG